MKSRKTFTIELTYEHWSLVIALVGLMIVLAYAIGKSDCIIGDCDRAIKANKAKMERLQ